MIEDLVSHIREHWAGVNRGEVEEKLAQMAENRVQTHSLEDAIRSDERISFIFEIKRKSPSLGELNLGIDPVARAMLYQENHAAAVSVLTEEKHFAGRLDDLTQVAGAIDIPVLRKDFIIDELQIAESLAYGADAVLLIVKLLGDKILRFVDLCRSSGIEPLVEVHDEQELAMVLDTDARLIGINNRDLDTLEIDLDTTPRLLPKIPPGRLVVSESGLKTPRDVDMLRVLGVDAVLIGTAISKADDPIKKLKEFVACRLR